MSNDGVWAVGVVGVWNDGVVGLLNGSARFVRRVDVFQCWRVWTGVRAPAGPAPSENSGGRGNWRRLRLAPGCVGEGRS